MHTSTIRLQRLATGRLADLDFIERFHMGIVVRFHPTALTADQDDETIRRLEQADGGFPPEGLAFHACFGSDGDLRVSEIWDSPQQFQGQQQQMPPQ